MQMIDLKRACRVFLYLAPVVGAARCLFLFLSGQRAELPFWIVGVAWVTWILFAYCYDKDLPAVGPFGYNNGKNQPARTIYTVVIPTTTLIVLFFFT